jgi:aspartyl-tRNA(Asn)/glutamyl-tRNA(Gln) amidotransferase subunit C
VRVLDDQHHLMLATEKTMSLTLIDIDRLAHLARLGLAPEQSARMCSQLNNFFGIVEKMRAVDTTGIVPLAHPVDVAGTMALRLRDDVVSEPDQRTANQRSAPAVESGLFLVPKVIE